MREEYLNSKDIKSKLVAGTVDQYIVDDPPPFDFKLLTEATKIGHTREPTQYAWKMGMGCEDMAHNLASGISALVESLGYEPASSKIDHAVYVERQNLDQRDDTNYLVLTNYQLLDETYISEK